jgi:iron(III) transport system permease protein
MREQALESRLTGARPATRLALDPRAVMLAILLAVSAYLIVPPLLVLIQTSFHTVTRTGDLDQPTAEHYVRILTRGGLTTPLLNSLWFSIGSAALALGLGTILAWIVERTNTPFRALGHFAVFISFAVPYILYTIASLLLLGKSGPVNGLLMATFGLAQPPLDAFSLWGKILVEALLWSPLVFLMMAAAFRSMDPSLEESATISGAGVLQTLRRVSLPIVLPAVLSVLLLVFIRAFESFEIPALIGLPGNIQVLTTRIYLGATRFPPQFGEAAAFAVILIVLVSVALVYYARLTRQAHRYQTITGKGFRPRLANLGRWRYLTGAILVSYFLLVLVLPLVMLLWVSLMPFNAPISAENLARISMANYVKAVNYPKVTQAAANSVQLGLLSATLVMLVATISGWLVVRVRHPAARLLDQLQATPIVFPGIVLGLAVLRLYLALPIPIYNTLWILVVAYVTRYVPYGSRYAQNGALQIHQELEEAAYVSGATWWSAFRRVVLPLLSPAFWAGWIFVFLLSLKELSMAVLLAGQKTPVMAAAMFDLWNDGQVGEVAAFGVLWTIAVACIAIIFYLIGRRQGIQVT